MLRHTRHERRRSATGYNSKSWQTDKNIDETVTYLLTQEEFPDRMEVPVASNDWIELYDVENGTQALMRSEKGDFQVSMTEYESDWKDNDIDLTYFHHPDPETARLIDRYVENI